MAQVYTLLDRSGPVNYFRFVINPESFPQTVENIFYVSFLIRDGRAALSLQDGQPVLATAQPLENQTKSAPKKQVLSPSGGEGAGSRARAQLIVEMTMDTWREAIALYDVRRAAIATRQPKAD